MTKILITGATGELGQQLRPRLLAAGYDVRGANRRPVAQAMDDGIEWAQVNFSSDEGLATAVKDVDCIIHAASAATLTKETRRVDVEGMALLNKLLSRLNCPGQFCAPRSFIPCWICSCTAWLVCPSCCATSLF